MTFVRRCAREAGVVPCSSISDTQCGNEALDPITLQPAETTSSKCLAIPHEPGSTHLYMCTRAPLRRLWAGDFLGKHPLTRAQLCPLTVRTRNAARRLSLRLRDDRRQLLWPPAVRASSVSESPLRPHPVGILLGAAAPFASPPWSPDRARLQEIDEEMRAAEA